MKNKTKQKEQKGICIFLFHNSLAAIAKMNRPTWKNFIYGLAIMRTMMGKQLARLTPTSMDRFSSFFFCFIIFYFFYFAMPESNAALRLAADISFLAFEGGTIFLRYFLLLLLLFPPRFSRLLKSPLLFWWCVERIPQLHNPPRKTKTHVTAITSAPQTY